MPTRSIKPISFRYSGNEIAGPQYNSMARSVMGIAESINSFRDSFVFNKLFESGLKIRVQKTLNGDRIAYIYVPEGGGIDLPGIFISINGVAHRLVITIDEVSGAQNIRFIPFKSVVDLDKRYFYNNNSTINSLWWESSTNRYVYNINEYVPFTSLTARSFIKNAAQVPDWYPKTFYGYETGDVLTDPGISNKFTSASISNKMFSDSNFDNIFSDEDVLGTTPCISTQGFGLHTVKFEAMAEGILSLSLHKTNINDEYTVDNTIEIVATVELDLSTFKEVSSQIGSAVYMEGIKIQQFIAWNKKDDNGIVRGAFITRQQVITTEYGSEYNVDYNLSSTLRYKSRGSIIRVIEISISENMFSAVIIKSASTLLDVVHKTSPAPRLWESKGHVTTICENYFYSESGSKTYSQPIQEVKNAYPVAVGYYNKTINIVELEIDPDAIEIGTYSTYEDDDSTEFGVNRSSYSHNLQIVESDTRMRFFDSVADIIPSTTIAKSPHVSRISSCTQENESYSASGTNSYAGDFVSVNNLFQLIDPNSRTYIYEEHKAIVSKSSSESTNFIGVIDNQWAYHNVSSKIENKYVSSTTKVYSNGAIQSFEKIVYEYVQNDSVDRTLSTDYLYVCTDRPRYCIPRDEPSNRIETIFDRVSSEFSEAMSYTFVYGDDGDILGGSKLRFHVSNLHREYIDETKSVVGGLEGHYSADGDIFIRSPYVSARFGRQDPLNSEKHGVTSTVWKSAHSDKDVAILLSTYDFAMYSNDDNFFVHLIVNGVEYPFNTNSDLLALGFAEDVLQGLSITSDNISSIAKSMGAF